MKNINLILRFEGLAVFTGCIFFFNSLNASWWWFIIFLLVPDIFMIGYLKSSKLGAIFYNIGHTYISPLILVSLYFFADIRMALILGTIWIAHIGMDRMLGYGLKLETNFRDTHLGKIGKYNLK